MGQVPLDLRREREREKKRKREKGRERKDKRNKKQGIERVITDRGYVLVTAEY